MAFVSGVASLDVCDGRFLAATKNVIVASMNYRLGALGFLSLPPATPGNAGLWDERLALRDNVAAFGGDPARLMLVGQCAGGSSVGFHLLSPRSQPLFTHAVPQSGALTAPWIWSSLEEAKKRGQRLGQLLGCTDRDETGLVGCLQGKAAGEFPKHEFAILRRRKQLGFPFVPTGDGDFLPDTPSRLLQAKQSQPMPILTGINASEGSCIVIYAGSRFNVENASSISWDEAAAGVAKVAGREVETGSPMYAYYFTNHSSGLSTPGWMGVPQGSELPYLFRTLASVGGASHTPMEAEVGLSCRVMQYFAVYPWSGIPFKREQWPLYDPIKQNFFRIGLESFEVEKMPLTQCCSILASLLVKKLSPTGAEPGRAQPGGL
ncbi:unnamed protein product [Caretta caretta]